MMENCQRRSANKEFYLHKYNADNIIEKYTSRTSQMSYEEQCRFSVARSRYALAMVDYLLQVGKRQSAIAIMDDLSNNPLLNLNSDTLLWLDYLCHQAKARYVPHNINEHRDNIARGFDCLMQCYILSSRHNLLYYKAESMKQISRFLVNDSVLTMLKNIDAASLRYINEDAVEDRMLGGNLAERALGIAQQIDDSYLLAESWRNLATCYFNINEAEIAIQCLQNAMTVHNIDSMPFVKAAIQEQLSMSYAAVNDKHLCDLHRNAYLDLQDSTRQDREIEARISSLQESTNYIWTLVACAVVLLFLLCIIAIYLNHLRKKNIKKTSKYEDELLELGDALRETELKCSNAQRAAVEQRARIAVINGMLPLIDRMKLAANTGNKEYISELVGEIEKQNAMLTQWIKMNHGVISPRIETISIADILNVVAKNTAALRQKGIVLDICQTNVFVKGDRTLTLFLVNTIVDNARKAMEGGLIKILCEENADEHYAEISISDNGKGIPEDKLAHLFEYSNIMDMDNGTDGNKNNAGSISLKESSHGFGLQNCRGIIDRYRKISSLFSVCSIKAESVLGKGTTISFRLPLVVKCLLLLLINTASSSANNDLPDSVSVNETPKEVVDRSATLIEKYADSLYYSNIDGHFDKALLYSDSCMTIINRDTTVSDEIKLSVFNETAVAALAQHKWKQYRYYNYLYRQLYEEYTADNTLATYCETMERNQTLGNIAMVVVLLLIIALIPVFWLVYLRHVIRNKRDYQQRKDVLLEQISVKEHEFERLHIINNVTDNQLSTLKHETMYYPTRIRQQIALGLDDKELNSTIDFYRELFAILSNQIISKQLSTYSFPMSTYNIKEIFRDVDCERRIICNKELMTYLMLLFKRHNSNKQPYVSLCAEEEKYVKLRILMDYADYSMEQAKDMFGTSTHNTDFLIMRQIIRETGNTTNHYGCGITYDENTPDKAIIMTISAEIRQ